MLIFRAWATRGLTRKKSPVVGEYNIEGQPLESVNVYKDLGLFTATTSCKNVETLPRKNDLSCFKSLLVTGL